MPFGRSNTRIFAAAVFMGAYCTSAAALPENPMPIHHANGIFEVTITPQEQSQAASGGLPSASYRLEKIFSGPLSGKAVGTMLSLGTPKPGSAAAYVALDQFTGFLDGKQGGFVLVHRGIMAKDGSTELDIAIATDSGSGQLAGIAGSLKIDVREGKHYYELTYTLP